MKPQAVLIVNTKSRQGQARFAEAKQALEERDVEITHAHALRNPDEVVRFTRQATASGVPLIVVGGGDGTLSCVASLFAGSRSVLGVLPLGTGNEFARDLSIPNDVAGACDIIVSGQISEIDLGLINGQHFINVATVGLTTLIAQELTPQAKRLLGKFVYVFAVARALMRVRPFGVTLETPEGEHTFQTLQVVIGNGRYHAGPFPLAPDATITDGKLVVYALKGASRWTLFRYALNLPGGHHVELPDVEAFTTTGGRIETLPLERVTVDGEISLHTPLTFGIVPRALRVMTPKNFGAQQNSDAAKDRARLPTEQA